VDLAHWFLERALHSKLGFDRSIVVGASLKTEKNQIYQKTGTGGGILLAAREDMRK
jgi:hypothetical protein